VTRWLRATSKKRMTLHETEDARRRRDELERREADAHAREAIRIERARAERLLNRVRAAVLVVLAGAAFAYAPSIPPAVQRVNWAVLASLLAWTVAQFVLARGDERAPGWLATVNPLVDITAVTGILLGYGLTQSPSLALKSPIFLAYFIILASRPITSSARNAALASMLCVLQYGALTIFFFATGRAVLAAGPVEASTGPGVDPLDEGARILLLIVAGAVATYATAWHERLARTYFRESADRERLETALTRAQLESLKLQLSPHFLFNTLNNISALISLDPRLAERMLGGLSDFLRLSLHNSGAQEVPLERELQMLERYLLIQQIRFAERLKVTIDVPSDLGDALVPNLLLQPLAENAIKHGLAPRAKGGAIEVRAERRNGDLVLRVADDGVGRDVGVSTHAIGTGIGLGNTRARLARLYGASHRFDVQSEPGHGFAVTVTIPYRTASGAA